MSPAPKALRALAAAKLVKEVKKRVYRRPAQDALWEYPHMSALPPELVEKIHAYDEKLAAAGRKMFLRQVIVRADETDFRNFFPLVDVNISTADAYATSERTEKSALFMVEGKITKLRDF